MDLTTATDALIKAPKILAWVSFQNPPGIEGDDRALMTPAGHFDNHPG